MPDITAVSNSRPDQLWRTSNSQLFPKQLSGRSAKLTTYFKLMPKLKTCSLCSACGAY